MLTTNLHLNLWRRNYFFNFSTSCIQNVNNTGTKQVSIMKQTAFWRENKTESIEHVKIFSTYICWINTGLSKKMGGIWNRYNLKSTGRIYTFGVLKCSEKFKVLDLP